MKKVLSLFFAVLMVASALLLVGCKRAKKSDFVGEYELLVRQNSVDVDEKKSTIEISKDHTFEYIYYNGDQKKSYTGEWKEYTTDDDMVLYCYYSYEVENEGRIYSELFTLRLLDDETLVWKALSNESSAVRYYEKID